MDIKIKDIKIQIYKHPNLKDITKYKTSGGYMDGDKNFQIDNFMRHLLAHLLRRQASRAKEIKNTGIEEICDNLELPEKKSFFIKKHKVFRNDKDVIKEAIEKIIGLQLSEKGIIDFLSSENIISNYGIWKILFDRKIINISYLEFNDKIKVQKLLNKN
jgi:hypothetical protein